MAKQARKPQKYPCPECLRRSIRRTGQMRKNGEHQGDFLDAMWKNEGGVAVQFQTPTRTAWARGGGGGGSRKLSIFGAFLDSPFHSEHFDYTQVG